MALDGVHATGAGGSEALVRVDLQKLVDEIAALRLNLHILWPLDAARVDFGEDGVALRACERDLAGDHFEYNAAERPEVCGERGHLRLDHLRGEVVHGADQSSATVHAAVRAH